MNLPPDPFDKWPKPIGRWSSLHAAAEALWTRAEVAWRPESVDPAWLLDGAMAYALDILEDVRRSYRLGRDSTIEDVLPFLKGAKVVEPARLRYVHRLLTYATDDERRFRDIVASMDEASS